MPSKQRPYTPADTCKNCGMTRAYAQSQRALRDLPTRQCYNKAERKAFKFHAWQPAPAQAKAEAAS